MKYLIIDSKTSKVYSGYCFVGFTLDNQSIYKVKLSNGGTNHVFSDSYSAQKELESLKEINISNIDLNDLKIIATHQISSTLTNEK